MYNNMISKFSDILGMIGGCRKYAWMLLMIGTLTFVVGCGKKTQAADAPQEDKHAKQLLQGIWLNEDDEDVAFRVLGDTIYYPDSSSQPVAFAVYADTLVMRGASDVRYSIVKLAAHLFEFKNQSGDLIKLVKTADKSYLRSFEHQKNVELNQKTLIKRDTIVNHGDDKYHLYVQVNPTSYKVYLSSMNDDGVQVDEVYYDNIVNLNVFHGAQKLFSRDFKKQDFSKNIPAAFLEQAVFSDLVFEEIDSAGIHYLAILAQPNSSISYQVRVTISFAGHLKIETVGE